MEHLELIARVVELAEEVQWCFDHLIPKLELDFSLSETVCGSLNRRCRALSAGIDSVASTSEGLRLNVQIRVLRNTLELLDVLGFSSGDPFCREYSNNANLRQIPPSVLGDFATATDSVRKHVNAQTQHLAEVDEAEKAISSKENIFEEWVKRNPGSGAILKYGPFIQNRAWDAYDETMVFGYSQNLWVVSTTKCNQDVGDDEHRQTRVIKESEAARIVLDANEAVPVLVLEWAKSKASPRKADSGDLPAWDSTSRTLTFKGKLARKVGPKASNLVSVLNCFAEDEWPMRIDSPFSPDEEGKEKLREAVRTLNSTIDGMEFRTDGTGMGVEWIPRAEQKQPSQRPEDIPF